MRNSTLHKVAGPHEIHSHFCTNVEMLTGNSMTAFQFDSNSSAVWFAFKLLFPLFSSLQSVRYFIGKCILGVKALKVDNFGVFAELEFLDYSSFFYRFFTVIYCRNTCVFRRHYRIFVGNVLAKFLLHLEIKVLCHYVLDMFEYFSCSVFLFVKPFVST